MGGGGGNLAKGPRPGYPQNEKLHGLSPLFLGWAQIHFRKNVWLWDSIHYPVSASFWDSEENLAILERHIITPSFLATRVTCNNTHIGKKSHLKLQKNTPIDRWGRGWGQTGHFGSLGGRGLKCPPPPQEPPFTFFFSEKFCEPFARYTVWSTYADKWVSHYRLVQRFIVLQTDLQREIMTCVSMSMIMSMLPAFFVTFDFDLPLRFWLAPIQKWISPTFLGVRNWCMHRSKGEG